MSVRNVLLAKTYTVPGHSLYSPNRTLELSSFPYRLGLPVSTTPLAYIAHSIEMGMMFVISRISRPHDKRF